MLALFCDLLFLFFWTYCIFRCFNSFICNYTFVFSVLFVRLRYFFEGFFQLLTPIIHLNSQMLTKASSYISNQSRAAQGCNLRLKFIKINKIMGDTFLSNSLIELAQTKMKKLKNSRSKLTLFDLFVEYKSLLILFIGWSYFMD